MNDKMNRPGVGVAVYIIKGGKFLIGERLGSHGGHTWAPPGGHLENGETWEECCVREVKEETNLDIENIRFFGLTNDIFNEKKHYITLAFFANCSGGGEPERMEPDKCLGWNWVDFDNLPEHKFLPVDNLLKSEYGEKLKLELEKSKK